MIPTMIFFTPLLIYLFSGLSVECKLQITCKTYDLRSGRNKIKGEIVRGLSPVGCGICLNFPLVRVDVA